MNILGGLSFCGYFWGSSQNKVVVFWGKGAIFLVFSKGKGTDW